MATKTTILKTEYLPPISTFWGMMNADHVLLEVLENYQKKSTRNRAKILGVNGIEVLSVPLKKGKNSRMPISEVEISYSENWQSKHLHSIKSAYGNAPYFEYYYESIETIIRTEYNTLINLNQSLLAFFIEALHLDIEYKLTTEYCSNYPTDYLDLRNLKFNTSEILGYKPKTYNQVFEEKRDFVAGLSILDLLMCKGPESILYI